MRATAVLKHHVFIDTKQATGRRKDPPRSNWYCTCGAGNAKLTTPDAANREADKHLTEVRP